ncbi:MAG TPA: recombinase family protein, partial [Chloroflexota bacterium]|nr:recombinase family protein [Chloroflexota bacterium]
SSPEGQLLGGMQGLIAEYERAKISERTRRGKLHKVSEGHIWRPRTAFGYRYVLPDPLHPDKEHRKHGHLEIVEEEAPTVRDVFVLTAGGMSLRAIARELLRRGVPTRRGGVWNSTRVWNMLANPIYSGNATYNRWKAKEPKRSVKAYRRQPSHEQRPREDWILVAVPAIVSLELQAAAQASLQRNKVLNSRNTKHDYLLSGLVFCGQAPRETGEPCGRRLSAEYSTRGRGDGRGYRCTRPYPDVAKDRTPCCKGKAEAAVLEAIVWERLVALLRQPDIVLQQMWEASQAQRGSRERLEAELGKAAALAEVAQNKITRLVERNLDGKIDDATFDRLQPQLIAERDAALVHVQDAQRLLQGTTAAAMRWDSVRDYCAAVADRLADLEQPECFERRQELVRTLITRVEVYPDRVSIVGVLPCVDADPMPKKTGLRSQYPHSERFQTQARPSEQWARTYLGERRRSSRPAWWVARAPTMVAVEVRATLVGTAVPPVSGGGWRRKKRNARAKNRSMRGRLPSSSLVQVRGRQVRFFC